MKSLFCTLLAALTVLVWAGEADVADREAFNGYLAKEGCEFAARELAKSKPAEFLEILRKKHRHVCRQVTMLGNPGTLEGQTHLVPVPQTPNRLLEFILQILFHEDNFFLPFSVLGRTTFVGLS